jgi:hypothetical protein
MLPSSSDLPQRSSVYVTADDGTLSRLEFLAAIFVALIVIAITELQRAKQGRRK